MKSEERLYVDYNGYDYKKLFWEKRDRQYDDQADRLAVRRLLPRKMNHFVDIAGGYGRLADEYLDRASDVTILDYADSLLQQAKEEYGDRIHIQQGDVYELPFSDESFDALLMVRATHHLHPMHTVLSELYRILKPGGCAVINVNNNRNMAHIIRWIIGKSKNSPFSLEPCNMNWINETGHYAYHPKWMEKAFYEAGFEVVRVLSVSNFRNTLVEKLLRGKAIMRLEKVAQTVLSGIRFGPSIYYKLIKPEKTKPEPVNNLRSIVKRSSRLIREKNIMRFRFVEGCVFDSHGNIHNKAALDQISMYGYDGTALKHIPNHRIYLSIDEIPRNAKDVFLFIEDTRFYHHIGVDFLGIGRAVINNMLGRGVQGASTLTMQLVKLLFLQEYAPTMRYKLAQMYLALLMERCFSKDQILEIYINTVFFSNHAYGMGAASLLYFHKPLQELSLSECMYLLIIAQRPGQCNPYLNAELVEDRRKKYLELCCKRKRIDYVHCQTELQIIPKLIPRDKREESGKYDEIYTVEFNEHTGRFGQSVQYVYDRLSTAGFSDSVIAGIMGNMHVESRFDPKCKNFQARGLCQWNGERVERLKSTYGDTYLTLERQMDFLLSEFDETSPNADAQAVVFFKLAQEDPTGTASYYSDLFQALVEKNLSLDHYDDVIMVTNPTGEFPVYNRLSKEPNAYDGLYYLDATHRRNYAQIYLECMKWIKTAGEEEEMIYENIKA